LRERRGCKEAAACRGRVCQDGDDAGLGLLLRTTVTGRMLDCVHPGNRVVAGFGVGQDCHARGVRRGRRTRPARDRASGARNGIESTNRGLCGEVGARHGCAAYVTGAAVHIIGAWSGRRRPRWRHLRRLCPMRTSPIAIGWCRCHHGTRPRDDDENEQGQCEALVTVRLIRKAPVWTGSSPRHTNRPDERRKPEQCECEVKALHQLPRHTVQVRRCLDGVPCSILARIRLVVRERVLDVRVPDCARHEELLECYREDLALAQPVVDRHRVTLGASARSVAADGARIEGGLASRVAVEASAADCGGQERPRCRVRARAVGAT
jgi:hypothetical protein